MGAELNDYLPVLLTILIAGGLAGAFIVGSALIGKRAKNPSPRRDTPYECGMPIITDAHSRFSVKFYLVAMLFILFAIEVIFLYPWAVVFYDLPASLVFTEMVVFIAILFVGWLFMVKKGVLRWEKAE